MQVTTERITTSTSPRLSMEHIPSPRALPVLGHLIDQAIDPLGHLERSAKKYGDYFILKLGGSPMVVVCDPHEVERILVKENKLFKKDAFLADLKQVVGNGLLTSEGEFWRRQRRLAQPAFHRESIASYANTFVEETAKTLRAWRARGNDATVMLHEDMMTLTLAIVTRTLFTTDTSEVAPRIGRALEHVMDHYADPTPLVFPWLMKVPLPRWKRFRNGIDDLDKITRGFIEERRTKPDANAIDLLAMLLNARDEDGSQMNDTQLRDEVLTLFAAGHETTALLLTWTWKLITEHPSIEAKLVEEIRGAVGNAPPTLADLPKLSLLQHVISESMRLYPPAWSVGREAIGKTDVGKYTVPAGAQIWMPIWVIQRDERWFDDPHRFKPERWEDQERMKKLPKYAYFPFGGGPRLCIGMQFAQMEAALVLASILQEFSVRVDTPEKLKPAPSVTLRPNRKVTARLVRRKG